MSQDVVIHVDNVRWDGEPGLSTIDVLASIVGHMRIEIRGTPTFDYSAACIVDLWDYLRSWQDSSPRTSLTYDGGIEGEAGLVSIVAAGDDRWWIGSDPVEHDLAQDVRSRVLDDAIERFGRAVAAEFEQLTGIDFGDWAAQHPDWTRRNPREPSPEVAFREWAEQHPDWERRT